MLVIAANSGSKSSAVLITVGCWYFKLIAIFDESIAHSD